MMDIVRLGSSQRWSDVVIHAGVARWVEVAEDPSGDARSQVTQVLGQIDATLAQLACDKTRLLEILIFLADENDAPVLNKLWDEWVRRGSPPLRACVQAGLAAGYCIEMIVTAAVEKKWWCRDRFPPAQTGGRKSIDVGCAAVHNEVRLARRVAFMPRGSATSAVAQACARLLVVPPCSRQ